MTSSSRQDAFRPTPVILAANPLRGLWPRSTPSMPYSLAPGRGGVSPAARLIALFLDDGRFEPPVLVASDLAVQAAAGTLRAFRDRGVRLIIVPADARNGISAVTAALEAAALDSGRVLLFVPATLNPDDGDDIAGLFHAACVSARQESRAVVFARRPRRREAAIRFVTAARPAITGLRQVERVSEADAEAEIVAAEADVLRVAAGPVAVPARMFLDIVARTAPRLLQGCANALALGERRGGALRPHAAYLSLFSGASIAEIMAAEPASLLLHPAGETLRIVRGWADLDLSEIEGATVSLLDTMPNRDGGEASGTGASRTATEGGFDTVIEDTAGIMIMRREIEPGSGLARECHFRRTETWTVVSGHGRAMIDGQEIAALPGSALVIPRGAAHALANEGKEMLVIYEVRAGALLGRDDALSLPAEKSA